MRPFNHEEALNGARVTSGKLGPVCVVWIPSSKTWADQNSDSSWDINGKPLTANDALYMLPPSAKERAQEMLDQFRGDVLISPDAWAVIVDELLKAMEK
jgi:hypothetical protein